ncbi:transposase family protein [Actinoplanes sp. NPDC051343]|uniref:transposase family protein n=1 Tax=Actinoplanes sp. NPDC051343 TaxID=3363906 RepID=UPI00379243A4
MRYPLSGLLSVGVYAAMAGVSSLTAMADWLHDLDDIARARLGFPGRAPATTTMWRLLIRLDIDLLSTILASWLCTRTRPAHRPRRPRYQHVIAGDGKTVQGAPPGRRHSSATYCSHWTPAPASSWPQKVTVNAKSNEIPAFTPLLDAVEQVLGSLKSDLRRRRTPYPDGYANEIAARGAHLLILVKGNRAKLFARLTTLPWAQISIGHQTRDRGHDRSETRNVKAVTLHTPRGIQFPHAQQAPDPHHHHQRQDQPRNRVLDHLTTCRRHQPSRPAAGGPFRVADRNLVHHVRVVTFP